MCVTSGPAKLANTIVAAWEIKSGFHAMGYQNLVQSLVGGQPSGDVRLTRGGYEQESQPRFDWDSEGYTLQSLSTANCMILPIPLHSESQVMDIGILDTRNFKNCLKDMAEALNPVESTRSMSKGLSYGAPRGEVYILEFDVYSIVMAQYAGDALNVLEAIPTNRRPDISEALLSSYEEWYGWPVAFCCFDNVEAKQAAPLVFTFKTRFPNKLFLPAIHGHDGNVPNLAERVQDDHTYIGGSCLATSTGNRVYYTDTIAPELRRELPTSVVGTTADYYHKQGDVVLDLAKVRQGVFELNRLLPPNAPRPIQPSKASEPQAKGRVTRSSSPW